MGAIPWGQLGPSGLAALAVVLVLTGRLVPRSYLKDAERREQEALTLARESQKQSAELIQQVRELTVVGQTNQAIVKAISDIAQENRQGRVERIEPKDLTQ